MKLRVFPILLVLLSAAGICLFAFTPVMTNTAKFVETSSDTDLRVKFCVYNNGTGAWIMKGTDTGVDMDVTIKIEVDEWDTLFGFTETYPPASMLLCYIGLGVAILGCIFSIFGNNSALRILGAFLCIAGAAAAITGGFLMWNFNVEFQEFFNDVMDSMESGFTGTVTGKYSTFGLGWMAAIISSGIIAIASIILLFLKPKQIY